MSLAEIVIKLGGELITGDAKLTASKAADLIKRLLGISPEAVESLLADPILREAYETASVCAPNGRSFRENDNRKTRKTEKHRKYPIAGISQHFLCFQGVTMTSLSYSRLQKRLIFISLVILLLPSGLLARELQKKTYKTERIAVLGFDGPPNVDREIVEYLTNRIRFQIADLGRFKVVNRRNVESVLNELGLGMSGRVSINAGQAREIGRYLSARNLILGNVNDCKATFHLAERGSSSGYYGEISATVKILAMEREPQDVEIIGNSFESNENIAKTKAVDNVAYQFKEKLRAIYSLEAQVIEAGIGKVVINKGQSDGIKKGMVFKVYRLGEELIEPDKGEFDGKEKANIGLVKIRSVNSEYSRASILKGRYRIKVGHKVEEFPMSNSWWYRKVGFLEPYISINYSSIPVNSQRNPYLANKDITQANYYGLSSGLQWLDKSRVFECQFGRLNMGSIWGWEVDISAKYKIPLTPDFLDVYIGGGMGYSLMYQALPNADKIFSQLKIVTDDSNVSDDTINFLFSLGIGVKVTNKEWYRILQPFAEVGWRHYRTMDEWYVRHKTGKKVTRTTGMGGDYEVDEILEVRIPGSFLRYPTLKLNGLTFRLGLKLSS